MNQPDQLSSYWLDTASRRSFDQQIRLRETCSGRPDPDVRVPSFIGAGKISLLAVPSLPFQDRAGLAYPGLVEYAYGGKLKKEFGLTLEDFADPTLPGSGKPLMSYFATNRGEVYLGIVNQPALARQPPNAHCHFTDGQTTPAQALELLGRATAEQMAGMVSVYPRELDRPQSGLVFDLTGLRLQFPPETEITVSGDGRLAYELPPVLRVIAERCEELGLPGIKQTMLPAAWSAARTQPSPRVNSRPTGDPSNPLKSRGTQPPPRSPVRRSL